MTMPELVEIKPTKKYRRVRVILLLLAMITSPYCCFGASILLDSLPASLLPPAMDFTLNIFESEARVENRTQEALYIIPITTTTGKPTVISQFTFINMRDYPLQPNQSIKLTYDSADMPLSGIAVCRLDREDCRLLPVDYSGAYHLDSFEDLPPLEESWLPAIRSRPQYNFGSVLFLVLSLLPVGLFLVWLYLGRLENKRAG